MNIPTLCEYAATAVLFVVVTSHVSGALSTDLGPAASGYRTYNGSNNHLTYTTYGQSGTLFVYKDVPAAYGDGLSTPAGASRPAPRFLSDQIMGATKTIEQNWLSDLASHWAQFIGYDIMSTATNSSDTISVQVPECELALQRTEICNASAMVTFQIPRIVGVQVNSTSPRQPVNYVTSFIDGSMIYGSDDVTALSLRTMSSGLLKTSLQPTTNLVLLPLTNLTQIGTVSWPDGRTLFQAGDSRINTHPGVQSLAILFVREHNRRAGEIRALNASLSDEELYQRARAWVIALLQKITFNEFLPALLGQNVTSYMGYNPNIDPSIDVTFMGAAFHFVHSAMSPLLFRHTSLGLITAEGAMLLRDNLFNLNAINDPTNMGDIESILFGMIYSSNQVVDTIYADDIRQYWPAEPFDLATLDLIRGRDLGLDNFGNVRQALNLSLPVVWANITSDTTLQSRLINVLGANPHNADVLIGGLAESHLSSSSVGPLFGQLILQQFLRLRDGDRFWYERDNVLNPVDRAALSSLSFSNIVLRNSRIKYYSSNPFLLTAPPVTTLGTQVASGTLNNQTFVMSSDMTVIVSVENATTATNPVITFTLCGKIAGFMAIGFHPSAGTMINLDIVVATLSSVYNNWTVTDYIAAGFVYPTLDTVQSVFGVADALDQCPGFSQGVTFKRYADTNDTSGDTVIGKDTPLYLVYAYSQNSPILTYHGPFTRGYVKTILWSSKDTGSCPLSDLSDGSNSNGFLSNIIVFHGAVMFIIFSIAFPGGLFVIRYLKTLNVQAMILHRSIMIAGALCAILVIGAVRAASGTIFDSTPHARLGLAVLVLLLSNVILGLITMYHLTFMKTYQRKFRLLHRWNGRLLFLGGIANSVLGVLDVSMGTSYQGSLVYWYAGFMCMIFILFILLGELRLYIVLVQIYRRLRRAMSDSLRSKTATGKQVIGFSWAEFNARIEQGSQWLVISGEIYDVSKFIDLHPGGRQLILDAIGTDATRAFYGTISSLQDCDVKDDLNSSVANSMEEKKEKEEEGKDEERKYGMFRTLESVSNSAGLLPGLNDKNGKPVKLSDRPKNLHSVMAMHQLSTMFAGVLLDYDHEDEDDLNELIRQALGKEIVQDRNAFTLASLKPRPEELEQDTRRQLAEGDLTPVTQERVPPSALVPSHYRNLRLVFKRPLVTSDSTNKVYLFRFAFERPSHTMFFIPGDSIRFQARLYRDPTKTDDPTNITTVKRDYTPLHVRQNGFIDLIIKIYPNGLMTQYLDSLQIGECIRVRGPVCHNVLLNPDTLNGCWPRICMIAAGTGITPMLLLIDFYLQIRKKTVGDREKPKEMMLIVSHRDVSSYLMEAEIDKIAYHSGGLLRVVKTVSHEPESGRDSWNGEYVGRLNANFLSRYVVFNRPGAVVPPAPPMSMGKILQTRLLGVEGKAMGGAAPPPPPPVPMSPPSGHSNAPVPPPVPPNLTKSAVVRAAPTLPSSMDNSTDFTVQVPVTDPNEKHDYHIFVCGPKKFNDSMQDVLLRQLGYTKNDVTIM